VGLKLNVIHQLVVYSDYVNLLGANANSVKKNAEALTDSSKEAGLEAITDKTKYTLRRVPFSGI
jgi:hypothetical protein